MFSFAQVTDTHFGITPDAATRVRAVLNHLAGMDPMPRVVLVTGDVADHGTTAEYDEARRVLLEWRDAYDVTMLFCTGNHDVRAPYLAALRAEVPAAAQADPSQGFHESFDVDGVKFVMLDSLIPEKDGVRQDPGRLDQAGLDLLRAELDEQKPTVVCLHHPPVTLAVGLMDPINLENADELAAVIRGRDNVLAVLVGHAHTMASTTFAGVPMIVGGGVASTVTQDAEDLPLVSFDLPPSFALHHVVGLDEDSGEPPRVITHWRTVR